MGYFRRDLYSFVRARLFCYNTYMKNRLIIFLLLLPLSISTRPLLATESSSVGDLVSEIQESLRTSNLEEYLMNFSPEIREKEGEKIRYLFDRFKIENVTLFRTRKSPLNHDESTIYVQALFQNPYSVVIETWKMLLQEENGRWQIREKSISGEVKELYKVMIPSDNIERVRRIEIDHVDIKLTFENALLLYDNIPGFETALIVLGDGFLHFDPSNREEKHQLEMIFNKRVLEDKLSYAYLRFSDFFFSTNIKIVRYSRPQKLNITQEERNKASSLFSKHYPRSFTIENSLNGELLSFLPKGKETVFEFEGSRIGTYTYIYSPFAEEEVNLFQWEDEKIISLYSPQDDEKERKIFFSFDRMFDITNYEIDIAFEPKDAYLSGKARIYISSGVGSLDGIKLKFNPALEILRINDKEKHALFYTQDRLRKYVYIYFIQPLTKGEESAIEVFYRGKLIPPRQTTDVVAGPQVIDETFINTPIRYESYLYTQSAYWYPSPPGDDYFQARLKIICPPEYTCVANGEKIEEYVLNGIERVEEIEKMGNSVYVFETKRPIKYISFIVGKFKKVEEKHSGLPLRFFRSSFLRIQKRDLLEEAKKIIRFYESKFGSYPYEKLTIVYRIWPRSGGHSPASFIVLNELPVTRNTRRFLNRQSPVDFSRWKEYFLAHEIAHQWWGQGMTWKSYHDQWLSEGLAQFSSILYLREKHGDKVIAPILKQLSSWSERKSDWGAITMGSRISYFDYEAFQSIIYNKTSLVLNLLWDLLGDELFFEGLTTFFSEHKYDVASTNDFIRTFNQISGQDLSLFFEGWLKSHTLPEVKVMHSYKKEGGRYILELTIRQIKDIFVFPLWVEWSHNGGKITEKIIIDDKNEKFNFELGDKPRKIKVNPRKAVPGRFH